MARCLREVAESLILPPPHSDDSDTTRVQLRWACSWYETKSIFWEIHFVGVLCVAERTFRVNFHRFVCSSMHLVNYYKNILKSFEKREKNKILSFFLMISQILGYSVNFKRIIIFRHVSPRVLGIWRKSF